MIYMFFVVVGLVIGLNVASSDVTKKNDTQKIEIICKDPQQTEEVLESNNVDDSD